MEEWRRFRDTPYEVSNLGNVRKLGGRLLRACASGNGYIIFATHVAGKRTNVLMHRAVLEVFIGPCPEGKEVNHKDGNKHNNALSNLEYVTRSENGKHAVRMGLNIPPTERASGETHGSRTKPDRLARGDANGSRTKPERLKRGEDQHNHKLTEDDVRHIRWLHDNGTKSRQEIADFFGVTRTNIYYIVNRKSWRHVND